MKKRLAVFTTGWCGEILCQFLTGIRGALEGDSVDIFLFLCYPTYIDTAAIKQGEMNIFNLPDLHDFDGAVLFGSGLDFKDRVDAIIERCNEARIPVILQGTRRDGISYVGSDNYRATKDMCAHLRDEHGVRKILFFAGTKDSHDSEQRLGAVRDYLRENNCEDDLIEVFYTNWENAAVTRHVTEMCSKGAPLPDAFICANDGLAMETCITLTKFGYSVPEDVLVTGYDHINDSKAFYPSIASIDQCFSEMGEAAVKLWKELMAGAEEGCSEIIDCRYVPGDSCGCFEYRNSDLLRRQLGREAFTKRAMNTYFNRKLDIMDSTILSCLTYQEFKEKLSDLLALDHSYEGESFHVILEPNYGLSIYDPDIRLNTDRYSKKPEILYTSAEKRDFDRDAFTTADLIPGYTGEGENHLYIFLPLHESDLAYGYLVFRDCLDSIENRYLNIYQNRLSSVMDKFRHALTLDLVNKRLLDLMKRDSLTKVNNRMAYDDKERTLQSMINTDPALRFAIAMFDVNNLKLINDSEGHEAGDEYLLKACRLICNVFKHSPVYRMGGDEFVVILMGEDYENRHSLKKHFDEMISPYTDILPLPKDYISVACGISEFDPTKDNSVGEVMKRADEMMYSDKAMKKKNRHH